MSVSPAPTILEVLNEVQKGLRIEFHWLGDRFGHTLFAVNGSDSTRLLESVEGTSDDVFPPSPPIAELHQQNDTLFLTGATTAGHWSVSVEPKLQGNQGCLVFDVACRLKSVTQQLSSSYKVASAHGDYQLRALPLEADRVQSSCQINSLKTTHVFTCDFNSGSTLPVTLRWRYQICMEPTAR